MKLGEKIKALRTSKLMTQSELAGNEITRNMLSRIENGAAQPSLDTLRYIAAKLNVSPGFLLAEGGDERIYVKHNEMNGIKTSYLTGDFRICRDMCKNSASADDDEVKLILAECTLGIATEEFCTGNLREACEYFDKALEACSETIYDTGHIFSTCAMYFKYMRKISATLLSNQIDESEAPVWASLGNPFCAYSAAFLGFDDESKTYVKLSDGSIYDLHIKAMQHMRNGDHLAAYECLHNILVSDETVPAPIMYFVFCDLEICCREINDFKGAYEYSNSKLALLQSLLS